MPGRTEQDSKTAQPGRLNATRETSVQELEMPYLGVPLCETDMETIRDRVWQWFSGPNPNPDQRGAVTFVDRVIDRQLNKARGILGFNSILIAYAGLKDNIYVLSCSIFASVLVV